MVCLHVLLPSLVVPLVLVHLRLEGVGFESKEKAVYLTQAGDSLLLKHPELSLLYSEPVYLLPLCSS